MTTITIALSKGRIFDETLPLLAAAGIGLALMVVAPGLGVAGLLGVVTLAAVAGFGWRIAPQDDRAALLRRVGLARA